MRWTGIALVACFAWQASAWAGELRMQVADGKGKPVADAVVRLIPLDATTPPLPAPAARTRIIDQRNEQFVPYVAVFRPGDRVVFRNSDGTRHHVYSFSPLGRFEMVLRPGQSSEPVTLERAGAIAVGCNIHDHMRTWLYVTGDAHVAVSDARGQLRIEAPAGNYRVVTWHPQLRPLQPEVANAATLGKDATTLSVRLSLLPDPRQTSAHGHRY